MSNKNSDYYFLRGGGEMGELIRAKDWSKTSLGDPADWPQSLCTMVAVMLDNPFNMYIAWGNEYTQLYNDGYRPILGSTKHPHALGIRTRETFSEIWHIIESMFDGVMQGKAVGFPDLMLPLNRNGFVEECYFDFSYSPIRTDDGKVGGVLVTVIETTNRKKADEALKESEARFRAIADDAPVFIFLAGENAAVDYLNKTWREYTGISTEDMKGRAWAEITHPDDIDPATEIYMNGFNNRESCSFENRQKGTDGIYRTILWKATPRFALNGQFIGMMGVGFDIHERKKSQERLRESEQRLRLVNEASGVAVWEWNVITGQIKWDNEMFKIYGVTPTVDNLVDYTTWSTAVVPEELAQQENILQNTVKKKGQSSRSFKIKRASDGELRHIEAIEIVRTNAAGQAEWVVGTNLDVTEKMLARKKVEDSERRYNLMLMQSPFAFLILKGKDMVVHLANESMKEVLGKGSNIEDKPLLEVLPEIKGQPFPDLLDNVYNTGIPFSANEMLAQLTRNGKLEDVYFNYVYQPYYDADNTILGVTVIAYDVTSSVIANKKIKENEQEIRKIKDQLELSITAGKIGVWHWDVKKDILTWSKEQRELYGVSESEVIVSSAQFNALIFPEDLKRIQEDQSGGNKIEHEYDFRIKRKNDGQIRWLKSRARNILDEQGELQLISGVNIDITEQVIALNKIQESEERFRSLAQALPQLVWVNDAEGNPEFASNRWREFTGIEPAGDKEWKEIVHPEDYEGIVAAWLHSKTTGTIYKHDVRLKSKEGEYRWHAGIGEAVLDEEKNIVKWVGAFTDIHEQKELSEIIKESAKQFNTLANNIQNLAWMADGEGYIYWYNQRWYDYTGTTLEEMKGWGWEKVHHPDHINRVFDFVKQAWQKNEPFELTFPLRAVNGEYRWFLTRAYPITNQEGKIINWIGTNTDITEQKKFTEQLEIKVEERTAELKGKNEELKKLNKELESFAYISSHDLQEPLRKIQTFATHITEKEESNLSDNGKDMFNRMQKSARRMQTLIQDLLAYSRTNTTERKFETTDLNKIIEEVREDLKEELKEKHATIEVNQLCDADIMPFQFRQLMHNLIGNSLKFSNPEHPPHIKIESEIAKGIKFNNEKLSSQNKYCHITVTDNGIGFEKQYSEKIFEVFQRLHGKNEYNGTGIGLSIVKKIVENHHGIITANGELNKGATFEIYIPVA